MTMRASRLAAFASLLLLLAGCGHKSTKPAVPADGLPAGTPQADSPAHLATRFEATFDSQVEDEYAKLLTADFRFHFSSAADPNLVSQYGDNWKRADELACISHLFDGFTNSVGEVVPGASRIDLTLTGIQDVADSAHADSTAHYRKFIVTSLNGTLEVPTSPDPTTYEMSSRQEFYMVRGDAAVLGAGQAATADRWYIRRWDDLSTFFAAGKGPVLNPARPSTLGSIKSQYAF
jgi:hypothetical protein